MIVVLWFLKRIAGMFAVKLSIKLQPYKGGRRTFPVPTTNLQRSQSFDKSNKRMVSVQCWTKLRYFECRKHERVDGGVGTMLDQVAIFRVLRARNGSWWSQDNAGSSCDI